MGQEELGRRCDVVDDLGTGGAMDLVGHHTRAAECLISRLAGGRKLDTKQALPPSKLEVDDTDSNPDSGVSLAVPGIDVHDGRALRGHREC